MNIYVAQGPVGRIAKFDQHGKGLMRFGQGEGGWFKKVGKVAAATGIAVDPAGNIYVADVKLNCIHKFDAQGHFVMKFGQRGT
jgi:DNA-binding beta-propeller fold protein YncE